MPAPKRCVTHCTLHLNQYVTKNAIVNKNSLISNRIHSVPIVGAVRLTGTQLQSSLTGLLDIWTKFFFLSLGVIQKIRVKIGGGRGLDI